MKHQEQVKDTAMSGRILIVDDDPVSGHVFMSRLKKRGYDTHFTSDPEEALRLAASGEIDLILLDYFMPKRSGLDVLKDLRRTYQPVDLPVIMVTVLEENEGICEALAAGANDYITKPVQMDVALARIQGQLTLKSFHKETLRLKELETLRAMIVTFNHELNNPLAIAKAHLERELETSPAHSKRLQTVMKALKRLEKTILEIRKLTEGPVDKETYAGNVKMFKIKRGA